MKMPLVKTPLGLQVMKTRHVKLSFGQRQALVLFDGTLSTPFVLDMLSHLSLTAEEVQQMVDMRLLTAGTPSRMAQAAAAEAASKAFARYAEAYLVALRLTSRRGLKGFRLSLAVEFSRDLAALQKLGPRILKMVGEEAYAPLARLLGETNEWM